MSFTEERGGRRQKEPPVDSPFTRRMAPCSGTLEILDPWNLATLAPWKPWKNPKMALGLAISTHHRCASQLHDIPMQIGSKKDLRQACSAVPC